MQVQDDLKGKHMDRNELEEIQKSWSDFGPELLDILESKDGGRGLLFCSADAKCKTHAESMARHLSDRQIVYNGETREEWHARIAFLTDVCVQPNLFEALPKYPCVFVHDLEQKPAWMFYSLKSLFEGQKRECLIVATCKDTSGIPGWLSSHFFELKA